ncbi:MAG TPA: FAD-dependent oxidoreductase [Thermoanaerobaculia bacterium]|nr:FAD-dependent oxidoreductase [Thermoanaerobaculia bacterium]
MPGSAGGGSRPPHVVVVGAGAFGGWSALALLRRGARVTLVDAWGPGNSRSSSGGETRVIRAIYGPHRLYVEWVARSFELWRELEVSRRLPLYQPTGALWMCSGADGYARAALPLLRDAGLPAYEISLDKARRRFPQVRFEESATVFYEERAGYLAARRACRAVAAEVAAAGGALREDAALPGPIDGGAMGPLTLGDGSRLPADAFVFACGPWLGQLFPALLGPRVHPTRQEVYYFGTPPGGAAGRFGERSLPVWIELGGERIFYGIPGNDYRGFKVADDTRGEPFDPTSGERLPTGADLARARDFLARRFPELAGAPLLEARVCQYENSPDGDLIADRHPEAANAWLVGGGSGHGFKLAPALGEHVAALVLGDGLPLPRLSLARLERAAEAPRTQFQAV